MAEESRKKKPGGLRIADCGLRIADCGLRIAGKWGELESVVTTSVVQARND
ncbi:MAG: hypothetical protein ACPGWR_20555 [Ardenticatenaceae bacterium]